VLECNKFAGIFGSWFKYQADRDENNNGCHNVGMILCEILGTEYLGRALGRGANASSNAHDFNLVV
jgi:hypothetical protein